MSSSRVEICHSIFILSSTLKPSIPLVSKVYLICTQPCLNSIGKSTGQLEVLKFLILKLIQQHANEKENLMQHVFCGWYLQWWLLDTSMTQTRYLMINKWIPWGTIFFSYFSLQCYGKIYIYFSLRLFVDLILFLDILPLFYLFYSSGFFFSFFFFWILLTSFLEWW